MKLTIGIPTRLTGVPAHFRSISEAVQHHLTGAFRLGALASLLLPAAAFAQSPYVTHTVPSSLVTQVNTLVSNATTNQQKLRAASLQWALNDAATQFNAGNPAAITSFLAGDTVTVAAPSGVAPAGTTDLEYSPFGIGDGLVTDVQNNLNNSTQIGSPNTAQYPLGLDLFPTIPNYPTGTGGEPANRIATNIFNNFATLITGTSVGAFNLPSEQVFGHPQSPYYGDPRLVPLMFNHMETDYEAMFGFTNPSADFSSAPAEVLEYLTLAARWPDLILPSAQKRWEASIYHVISQYYNYNVSSTSITSSSSAALDRPWTLNDPARAYPNQDFRECEPMIYAAYIFSSPINHNNYPAAVATNLKNGVNTYLNLALSDAILFPDGAFTYVYESNEVGDYQGSETGPMGDLYKIMAPLTDSVDKNIWNNSAALLEGARLYYPIEFPSFDAGPLGTADPSWKQGFLSGFNYEGEGMLYSLASGLSTATDPLLWRLFDENGFAHEGDLDLVTASCIDTSNDPFNDSRTAALAADLNNYFTYDQNREGPAGKFGHWIMVGSARMNHIDVRGTDSQAGFLLTTNTNGVTQPAVYAVAPGNVIFTSSSSSENAMINDPRNSTIVRPGFATLACAATMGGKGAPTQPFATIQDWIYTPSREVCLATLVQTSASSQTEYGVGGFFNFGGSNTFAAYSGTTPRLQYGQYGSSPYSYDLVANVKENTYGHVSDDGGGTIELLDQTGHGQKTYPVGVVGHYLVDYHPASSSDASTAASISTGLTGVYGLEIQEGTQVYRLIHNTTSSSVVYTAALPSTPWGTGSVEVHHAEIPEIFGSTSQGILGEPEVVGETYRAAWMYPNAHDAISSVTSTYVALSSGNFSYTVPANSHILIMSIPNMTDGHTYELEPQNALGSRLDVVSSSGTNGTLTDLYHRNGWVNQKWQAHKQSDGSFILNPQNAPGAALEVSGTGSAPGTLVDISATTGASKQKWQSILQPNGCVLLEPESIPGSCLEVYKKATADGSPIDVYPVNGGTNQQWKLYDDTP